MGVPAIREPRLRLFLSIACALALSAESPSRADPSSVPAARPRSAPAAAMPAFFVPNAGQADSRVLFQGSGPLGSVSFGLSEIVVTSYAADESDRGPRGASRLEVRGRSDRSASGGRSAVRRRLLFEGASPKASLVGLHRLRGIVNVFHGSDPARWRTRLPTYGAVLYRDLYPGVDLELETDGARIRGTFRVAPGADAAQVRWRWDGAGDSEPAALEAGPMVLSLPAEARRDPASALAAGPAYFSTFFGGGDTDIAYALAVDSDGAAYLTGSTLSTDLPTSGPIDGSCGSDSACDSGNPDAFVAKLDPDQTGAASLVYATYLGGSGADVGVRIAVDASGNAYVAGIARTDFPTTGNAYQQTFGSATSGVGADAFLSKLAPDGASLLYSTYLGGSSGEGAWGIAVDGSGSAWLTGETFSSDFPTTAGAYKTACGNDGSCDGTGDAYVARLDTTQSGAASLLFATFFGAGGEDHGFGLALGAGNTISVTGRTSSTDLPHPGAFQSSYGGGSFDAFVAKLPADGASLLYASYLGGEAYDDGYTIAVDGAGRASLTGTTGSSAFPTTAGALQSAFGGVFDAHVVRVDPAETGSESLVYSTFLGGGNDDDGFGLALDASGVVHLTGYTLSTDFPVAGCPPRSSSGGGYDAFLSRVDPSASGAAALISSGYFGGVGTDAGYDVARDGDGHVLFAGQTSSADFPVNGAFATSLGGPTDAFLVRLAVRDCPAVAFFTVAPCRVLDTRAAAGPAISGGSTRTFPIAGSCGVPSTARAVSLNVTVTVPSAAGDLRLYPGGTPLPVVSTINYRAGRTRANNSVAALGAAGDIAVRCDQPAGTTVHLIVDVNGYFE